MTVDTDWPPTTHTPESASHRWARTGARIALGLILGAAILAGGLAVAHSIRGMFTDDQPTPAQVVQSTFVDDFGRQCTQITTGTAVALDCDYKPVESRLGSLLDGSGQ